MSALLASRNWDDLGDIADVYVRWGAHVYGEGEKVSTGRSCLQSGWQSWMLL